MSKYRFSGALNAANFPFVSTMQGRTVVQPQLDNKVPNQGFYGSQESANYDIPQLLFCENVVPTAEGLQSVGFEAAIGAFDPATDDFDQAITLRDEDENVFLFSPAGGKNYIFRGNTGEWESVDPIGGGTAVGVAVSRAYVNGRTFICYEGLGIYEYDSGAVSFDLQTVTGITGTDIRGIGASNNYLIAYTDITVYWSSLVDPLDFTPSTSTGAGFSIPQDVKAKIHAIVGTAGGFIIYTAKNAVAAVYTNNIRAPFAFKEIANAGGLLSYEQTTSEQNSGPQYAWTTGGLQKITVQGAESVSAAVNDFLAGRIYETWSTDAKLLRTIFADNSEFQVKVAYISSRWLVISYCVDGSGTYQYALLYDTILKRWGKVKFDHVDCFSYPYPNVFGDLTYDELTISYESLEFTSYDDLSTGVEFNPLSKKSIAFLAADGTVTTLVMDYDKPDLQTGVVIFGKFQLVRARMMTMQTVDLEGVYRIEESLVPNTPAITCTALTSLDGKNLDHPYTTTLLKNTEFLQRYARRATGINFGIAVEGSFSLSSYILEVTAEGDR